MAIVEMCTNFLTLTVFLLSAFILYHWEDYKYDVESFDIIAGRYRQEKYFLYFKISEKIEESNISKLFNDEQLLLKENPWVIKKTQLYRIARHVNMKQ